MTLRIRPIGTTEEFRAAGPCEAGRSWSHLHLDLRILPEVGTSFASARWRAQGKASPHCHIVQLMEAVVVIAVNQERPITA